MTAATHDPRLLEALAWQLDLGADEAIGERPVDRFALGARPAPLPGTEPAAAESPTPAGAPLAEPRGRGSDAGARADPRSGPGEAGGQDGPAALAAAAGSLEALAEAMQGWQGAPLRLGARNFVFADGNPRARVMLLGEAPGAEEDRQGKPFVGASGRLLDLMLAAIGLSRAAPDAEAAVYIANILPWRPPGNRSPSDDEVAAFLPFVERHVELAGPDVVVTLGGVSTKHLLGTGQGIMRSRGRWVRHGATGLPVLPMLHPAYLLRNPADKRLAWRDLLALRAFLDGEAGP